MLKTIIEKVENMQEQMEISTEVETIRKTWVKILKMRNNKKSWTGSSVGST